MLTEKYSKLFFALFLFFSAAGPLSAQRTGIFRGYVSDSESGEILPYCNVLIQDLNIGTSSDSRGYFVLSGLPANRYLTVAVSYVGYQTKMIDIFLQPQKITHINIKLEPESYKLDTVEKVASPEISRNPTDMSLEKIKARELELLPKGVETDIFRSLQYLPGVQKVSDVSARYNVRGGASNENLVLFNGATIYSPFHAMGIFSVVDPEMINSAAFYKGGFPIEYGGRLSSVLSINSKDGNRNKYSGKISTSYLSGKLLLEGPIPNGSFIVTGRKSYSTEILKKFLNDQDVPLDFYDLSFSINYMNPDIIEGRKFSAYGFFSSDNIDNSDPYKEDFKWQNQIAGLKFFQMIKNSPLYYELNVSWSNFTGEVNPNLSEARKRMNIVKDFSIRSDVNYIAGSKDEVSAGAEIKEISTDLVYENKRGAIVDIRQYGVNISVFAKYKLLRFKEFGAEFGNRFNITRLAKGTGGDYFLEPRLNLFYEIFPDVTLKGFWGLYNQEFTTLTNENEVLSIFEPWIITPAYLNPAQSVHYIVGIETSPLRALNVSAEGYYKLSQNLSTLNERKYSAEDPDLVPAKAESYGFEIGTQFNDFPFKINASYTLSWAFKEVYNETYRPRYDSRHNFNILIAYDFGYGLNASVAWQYSSGLPFTQIAGYYERLYFGDLGNRVFNFEPYTILSGRNLGMLPDYHRLDFNLSKSFQFYFTKIYLELNIINIYDRENIFYFDRNTGKQINMLPFLPTATIKLEI